MLMLLSSMLPSPPPRPSVGRASHACVDNPVVSIPHRPTPGRRASVISIFHKVTTNWCCRLSTRPNYFRGTDVEVWCLRSTMISTQAKADMPRLRPSFTAILWGCGMALWPRMLQHIHSHVDGDVSVAALRMPAEAEPFVEAILAICAPLLTCRTQRSPSRPAPCFLLALTRNRTRLCGSQIVPNRGRIPRTSANSFVERYG